MEFYSVLPGGRPTRLCEATRRFAYESLKGKYGDEALRTPFVVLDDVPGFKAMTELEQYDCALARIVREAPVRLCEQERVCGAATLGGAISHVVPASFGGQPVFQSVSHVTLGFDRVLREGVNGLRREVQDSLRHNHTPEEQRLLASMMRCIDALCVWHGRYLEATKTARPDLHALLERVPMEPPRNFHEAVQSLWFLFAFTRLCGNWSGIGRIDWMLGPYLQKDLESGALTRDEAREILASFWIKGCEWIQSDTPPGTGDAQHYQNIVLSGVDADGRDVTNEVTYLVLEVVEELGISDFPIAVRVNPETDPRLLRKVAEVVRHGGGVVAVYNEPLVIESMLRQGYSLQEARSFANDGCWEVQVPGKTYFIYEPFDALAILQKQTLRLGGSNPAHFDSFEALYRQYKADLQQKVESMWQAQMNWRLLSKPGETPVRWRPMLVCPLVSLLTEGCIESGCSYYEGGPVYTVFSPHIGGLPDAANCLYAIQKLVFEENKRDFDTFLQILESDWKGEEALRQYACNHYDYFGNDNDEVDAIAARILSDFADVAESKTGKSPIHFPAGVSTFGRQIEWRNLRTASAHGHRRGDILSGNFSPTPDTDHLGATAIIRSYCKTDLVRMGSGAALDIKLFPTTVEGENGLTAIESLVRGFVSLGGFFMQMDVMDAEVLRQAQLHPEAYKTLAVRVSGWSARFVTLERDWQDMIIERTAQGVG